MRSRFSASIRKSSSARSDVPELVDDRRQVDHPADAIGARERAVTRPSSTRSWSISGRRAGPLHLHDDAPPVGERGAVHLTDGAGRERTRIDGAEHVLPRDAELLLHHRDDLGLAHRRDRRLQRAELLDVLGRDEIRSRRQHLAELAERGSELLERLAQLLRRLLVVRAGAARGRRCPGPPRVRAPARSPEPGRRGGRRRRSRVARPGAPVFTTVTVQRARCVTRLATLPSRNSLRPRIPLLPTTSTSAPTSSAAATISSAIASPATTLAVAPGVMRRADSVSWAAHRSHSVADAPSGSTCITWSRASCFAAMFAAHVDGARRGAAAVGRDRDDATSPASSAVMAWVRWACARRAVSRVPGRSRHRDHGRVGRRGRERRPRTTPGPGVAGSEGADEGGVALAPHPARAPRGQRARTRAASPWPPPPQRAAAPRPPPRRRSSWMIEPTMRAPDMPTG